MVTCIICNNNLGRVNDYRVWKGRRQHITRHDPKAGIGMDWFCDGDTGDCYGRFTEARQKAVEILTEFVPIENLTLYLASGLFPSIEEYKEAKAKRKR